MSRRAAARLLQRLASSTAAGHHHEARVSSHVHRAFCSAPDGPSTSGRDQSKAWQRSGSGLLYSIVAPHHLERSFMSKLLQHSPSAASKALHVDAMDSAAETDAVEVVEPAPVATYGGAHSRPPAVALQDEVVLHIRAYHLGGEIDLPRFCAENNISQPLLQRDHVVIDMQGLTSDSVLVGGGTQQQDKGLRAAVVYRFGTVVFFHMNKLDEQHWVDRLRECTSEPLSEPVTDATVVAVRESLEEWFALEPDKVVVQQLDMGNVRVISHIIGQSVALDHYNKKVDQAIEKFTPILGEIAHSGRSDTVKSTRLLQLIGSNSLLYTYVVTKLGLLDPSQIAWQSDKHYEVWRTLRHDYEIERRFEALKNKLGPMLENAKFILEVREDKKSERSELIIILLIFAEIVLHLAHHFLPQLAAVLEQL